MGAGIYPRENAAPTAARPGCRDSKRTSYRDMLGYTRLGYRERSDDPENEKNPLHGRPRGLSRRQRRFVAQHGR